MGLLSNLKRRADTPAKATAPAGEVDPVQRARMRARQRLIGAVVLVIIGIVGFPLVFETQPRPIPVDVPIEIPRKDNAPPLAMPAKAPEPAASATAAAPDFEPSTDGEVITESSADAGREVATAPKPAASKPAPAKVESKPAPPKPAVVAVAKPLDADAARARDLLEGKSAAPAASAATTARFIVQVGAYADAASAQETRSKIEKLGMKTYTQVTATPAGNRIRVRVGPFGTKDEADRALAKAKGAGLNALVLAL